MTITEATYFFLGATVIVSLLYVLGRILLHHIGMHRVRQMEIERLANKNATTEKNEGEE